MDQEDHGDHGAGCWTRSTVVLVLHFADVLLWFSSVWLYIAIYDRSVPGVLHSLRVFSIASVESLAHPG